VSARDSFLGSSDAAAVLVRPSLEALAAEWHLAKQQETAANMVSIAMIRTSRLQGML
jgi:hypothetical protein